MKFGHNFTNYSTYITNGNFTSNGTHDHYHFLQNLPMCTTLECIIVERYRHDFYHVLLNMSILLGITGFIGAVGNILVIMVFARNRVKKPSTYFMLTLAIIDLMVCMIVIPGVIAREWRMKFYSDFLCKGLEFMRSLMIPASALILVAIAFDRFFLICMSTKEIMTTFVAKITIFVIMLIGMSLGIPPLLSISVYVIENYDNYYNWEYCVKSDRFLDDNAQYHYWYFVTALFGAMIVVIFILYLLIFKKVIQQSRMWKNRKPKIFPYRQNTAGKLGHEPVSHTAWTDNLTRTTNTFQVSKDAKTNHAPSTMDHNPAITPSTSGLNSKSLKTRNSKQSIPTNSSSTNIKTMSDIKRRSIHVKTTEVLFIVTLVYIFSFLPTFLETNAVIESNKYLTYVYFVNNAANPIIYSFMNAKFRDEAHRLYCKCIKK